jgi:hypothetical protein
VVVGIAGGGIGAGPPLVVGGAGGGEVVGDDGTIVPGAVTFGTRFGFATAGDRPAPYAVAARLAVSTIISAVRLGDSPPSDAPKRLGPQERLVLDGVVPLPFTGPRPRTWRIIGHRRWPEKGKRLTPRGGCRGYRRTTLGRPAAEAPPARAVGANSSTTWEKARYG